MCLRRHKKSQKTRIEAIVEPISTALIMAIQKACTQTASTIAEKAIANAVDAGIKHLKIKFSDKNNALRNQVQKDRLIYESKKFVEKFRVTFDQYTFESGVIRYEKWSKRWSQFIYMSFMDNPVSIGDQYTDIDFYYTPKFNMITEDEKSKTTDAINYLANSKTSIVIYGDAGIGKTTLLQRYVSKLTQETKKPILVIRMRDLENKPSSSPIFIHVLEKLGIDVLRPNFGSDHPKLDGYVNSEFLNSEQTIIRKIFFEALGAFYNEIIIDGYDEIRTHPNRNFIDREIKELFNDPNIKVFLSSRDGVKIPKESSINEVEISPLSKDQAIALISKFVRDKPEVLYNYIDDSALQISLKRPLNLVQIAASYSRSGRVPHDFIEVYDNLTDFYQIKWNDEQGRDERVAEIDEQKDSIFEALSRISDTISFDGRYQFSVKDFRDMKVDDQWYKSDEEKLEFLYKIQSDVGLIESSIHERFEFFHRRFQDYLTACYLKNKNMSRMLTRRRIGHAPSELATTIIMSDSPSYTGFEIYKRTSRQDVNSEFFFELVSTICDWRAKISHDPNWEIFLNLALSNVISASATKFKSNDASDNLKHPGRTDVSLKRFRGLLEQIRTIYNITPMNQSSAFNRSHVENGRAFFRMDNKVRLRLHMPDHLYAWETTA